jgi:4-hydroxyphenylpyruvate dioxygenase
MSPSPEPGTGASARPLVRRSIATVSLSGPLEEKLAAAAGAGFDGVEIFEGDLITCRLSPADVRLRAADLGLAVVLYQPFRDFEAVPDDLFRQNLRRAERKFELMTSLGADTLLVCSNVCAAATDDDALAADQLGRLAEQAREHGIRIAYEALAWGRHVSSYERAWRLVAQAAHPQLGVCLDSFHILSLGHDPAGIRRIPAEKIFFLQLADAPLLNMQTLAWSRHHRCFPGQGGFDMTGFTADVLAAGYSGPWSLEVFNDVFRQADAERTAVDGMRSLLILENSLAARAGTGPQAADPGPVTLTHLPAPVELSGYAFVELGVDGLMEPTAEDLLRGMGFARTGRHLSKPVQLWEQGGIRLLVNRTRADDTSRPHGLAGVSAVAVESQDLVRSAQRARALLAPAIPRSTGPGEADLTAVTAPDGTALFFCRTDAAGYTGWAGDFEPTSEQRGERSLLATVDHVALSQSFDYFDEAVLFYRSLLGMRDQASEEVASPYGLMRSRAIRSAGGGVRLVLNVPVLGGGRPTEAAAYQHVAFSCRDVFAAARAVRSAGIPTLPVPVNYYDDLVARFDLAASLVARLRESGILYDRDARGGEFFHFYTVTIGRRLFFEIVQRTGGYDGFGAFNTPVRMAAQLHHTAMGAFQLG